VERVGDGGFFTSFARNQNIIITYVANRCQLKGNVHSWKCFQPIALIELPKPHKPLKPLNPHKPLKKFINPSNLINFANLANLINLANL
jgi:hypothetical protein